MKLTKEKLKRIIKEELNSIEEQEERSPVNIQAMKDRAIEIINKMSPNKLIQKLDKP
jgi:hypothetical protein